MPGTEIATSLTHEKIVGKLLAMTKVGWWRGRKSNDGAKRLERK